MQKARSWATALVAKFRWIYRRVYFLAILYTSLLNKLSKHGYAKAKSESSCLWRGLISLSIKCLSIRVVVTGMKYEMRCEPTKTELGLGVLTFTHPSPADYNVSIEDQIRLRMYTRNNISLRGIVWIDVLFLRLIENLFQKKRISTPFYFESTPIWFSTRHETLIN